MMLQDCCWLRKNKLIWRYQFLWNNLLPIIECILSNGIYIFWYFEYFWIYVKTVSFVSEFNFQITERSTSVQIFYLLALIKEMKVRELISDIEPIPKQFVESLKREFARKNLLTVQVNENSNSFLLDIGTLLYF